MQRHFKLNVNGTNFDVVVEEVSSSYTPVASAPAAYIPAPVVSAAAPVAAPAAPSAPAGAGDQCAQMGGVVASIAVKEGQAVNPGDRIAELEAMKMKVPVMATCSGKVSRIAVAVGDAVESGQVLVVIS
ncbi:MAG: biotin/lipoyl-binding protein [Propionivibrio sp.]|jgi:biotin carboxyl carrier protein|uniref:biotin/lipoyl-containing protein n=1 Tax=Propionivibrio sp. TaxID=2212460 RepID=UPI001B7712DE|nr:biotin/lipoyl-containing protein [Propionivibrio sp.]MBP7203487.1 biotin/lipoyl-binding protein [Propionivibrio sp.]